MGHKSIVHSVAAALCVMLGQAGCSDGEITPTHVNASGLDYEAGKAPKVQAGADAPEEEKLSGRDRRKAMSFDLHEVEEEKSSNDLPEKFPREKQNGDAVSLSQFSSLSSFLGQGGDEEGLDDLTLNRLLGSSKLSRDPVCRGRWQYRNFDCFRQGTGPACGEASGEIFEDIVEYNGCALPQFGKSGTVVDREEFLENIFYEVDDLRNKNWCKDDGKELDKEEHVTAVIRMCSEKLQKGIREVEGPEAIVTCFEMSRAPDPNRPNKKYCHFGGKNYFVMWKGKIKVEKPAYVWRNSDPACGRKEPIQRRKVADRTFHTCRHPDFGRESANVCNSPESLFISEPGLRRSDLNREHFYFREDGDRSAECMTCDDLPYSTDAEVAAKLDCLKVNLHFSQSLRQDADRGDPFAKSVRPEELIEDIRARGAALFESIYTVKPAGVDFLQFYSPDLTETHTQSGLGLFNGKEKIAVTNMCRALLQTHVDPRRIVDEYALCLTLATLTETEKSMKKEVKSRVEAMKIAMSLFARYVRAMQGGEENGRVEANTARFLVQTWYGYALTHLSHLRDGEIERVRDLMQSYANKRVEDLKNWYDPE